MTTGQTKMLSIILCICMVFGLSTITVQEGHSDTISRTLLQVVWDIGIVDKKQADIEKELGNDPISLIKLPKVTSWNYFPNTFTPDMSETALSIPSWYVLDGSGIRNGAHFSVWCDHGGLYQDTLLVLDLKKAEGNAAVEWAFDGEPFVKSLWTQKDQFIIPQDDFPHDAFVRRLAKAKFLVLKIKGQKGLGRTNPKMRPQNIAIVPVALAGDKAGLLKLIEDCSHSRDRDKTNRQKP